MSLEQKINYQLNKIPGVKKVVKRVYQRAMYAISPKIKSEGNITRISPNDPNHEYFFGYYDKSPWDASDRYMLCMRANNTWSDVSPKEKADIILIDTTLTENDANRVKKIAETSAWNVQQSCMLQWLGPDFSSRILFNDCRDGKYVSVIKEIESGAERVIPMPVYTVSADGKTALTLDFSRLYNLRPGYGYYNVPEKTKDVALPDATAVWKIDLESGSIEPLLTYKDFATFQPRPEMQEVGSVHKVNHLMLSPSGKRCMVLYRWFVGQRKYTRLVTFDTFDGKNMYVLSDDDMVSHCFWKDDNHILAFENKKDGGPGYYFMTDKTQEFIHCWPQLSNDGHPSYSPDRSLIVTDTYPDRARVAEIKLMDGMDEKKNDVKVIARVFAPFKYDNDTRCDLHPRWNHVGNKICFDSVFEGHRGLYVVDISDELLPILSDGEEKTENTNPKYSIVTPMYNSFSLMNRYFVSLANQTFKDFEVIIVDDCSTDDSFEKLCEYVERCPLTVKVLRTEKNGGPGIARNMGMDAAKGEWLTFIDNDDWVDIHLLEKIERVQENSEANSIIYDYYTTNGKDNKVARSMYYGTSGEISFSNCMIYVRNHTVGKFYKLSKCRDKGIKFPPLKRCEDVAFVIRAIIACESAYYLAEPLYYYYQRPMSLSNNASLDESDMIKAFNILEKEFKNEYPRELMEKSVPDILYGVLLMMCKAGKRNREIIEYINNYEKKYPQWEKAEVIAHLGKAKQVFLKTAKKRNIPAMKAISKAHSFLIGRV